MAGGIGSRFWPMSTDEQPKQFIDILGTGKTLIEQTFERLNQLCPCENIFISTNEQYKTIVNKLLPQIPESNILCEPFRKNTAPCIAYAAYKIKKINPEAVMIVAPSDHLILKEKVFMDVVNYGFDFAQKNQTLITIGLKPHRPDTGYGYIHADSDHPVFTNELFSMAKVKAFKEKPNLDKAKEFLADGNYFWNAGIFIWSVQSIINGLAKYLSDINELFIQHYHTLDTDAETAAVYDVFNTCRSISIDYGVMEKADNVYTVMCDLGWSDLGTWGALHEISPKNADGNAFFNSNVFFNQAKNNIVKLPAQKSALIDDLNNYIIVDTPQALLICKKENEQKIKEFSEILKTNQNKN